MPDLIEDVPRLEIWQLRALPNWEQLRDAGGARVEMALADGTKALVAVIFNREPPAWPRRRWWLICDGCGSRRRHLYFHQDELKCRQCHQLLYAQQALPHCSWREEVGLPILRSWRALIKEGTRVDLAEIGC